MNITIQDELVQQDFDIFSHAGGAYRATRLFFPTRTTPDDRFVSIQIVASVGEHKLNAIEVHHHSRARSPEDYTVTTSFPSQYFNFGASVGYRDARNRVWKAVRSPEANVLVECPPRQPFLDADDDTLYCSEEAGSGTDVGVALSINVPNDQYHVILHFAETSIVAVGERVMDVFVEGEMIAADFDIFDLAKGNYKAIRLFADVSVGDGTLTIDLIPRVGAYKINAMEIHHHSMSQ